MENIIAELKQLITFKDTTDIGDIVLIAAKQPQMLLFARVIGIERDKNRRDEWYHLHMTILSIPLQPISWTLRVPQMTGQEVFTMGGEERFVQAIDFHQATPSPATEPSTTHKSPLKRVK